MPAFADNGRITSRLLPTWARFQLGLVRPSHSSLPNMHPYCTHDSNRNLCLSNEGRVWSGRCAIPTAIDNTSGRNFCRLDSTAVATQ